MPMTQEIIHEVDLLLNSMALGVCIVFVYDIFLSFRKALHHSLFFIGLEDFVFLSGCTISFFLLFYKCNSGVVRGYAVGGIIFGMFLYHKLLSQHLVFIMSTAMKKTIYLVVSGIKSLFKPIIITAKKVVFKAKVGLTVCIKSSKLTLCKRPGSSLPKKKETGNESKKGRVHHGRIRYSKKSQSQTRISEKT